jgi:transposase
MEKTVGGAVDAGAKRALWSKRMAQWEGSGLAQREFCANQGLALSTFQWWRRRFADSDQRTSRAVFLPLPMNPEPVASATSVVEVELRSGTRLRFEGEAAQVAVRALVTRVR